jgi:hypothetical protein
VGKRLAYCVAKVIPNVRVQFVIETVVVFGLLLLFYRWYIRLLSVDLLKGKAKDPKLSTIDKSGEMAII